MIFNLIPWAAMPAWNFQVDALRMSSLQTPSAAIRIVPRLHLRTLLQCEVLYAGAGTGGAQSKHMRELEATNGALKAQLQVLEEEAATSVTSLRALTDKLAAATERAVKAESQVLQLEAEADAQGRQIALLEVSRPRQHTSIAASPQSLTISHCS